MSAAKRAVSVLGLVSRHRLHDSKSHRTSHTLAAKRSEQCLLDTWTIVKDLKTKGFPSHQAEAIVSVSTDILNEWLENVAETYNVKDDMEQKMRLDELDLARFRSEIKSFQDRHYSKFRFNMDKIEGDITFQIDEDMHRLKAVLEEHTTNHMKEIYAAKAQISAMKYDVAKYYIGTIISTLAVSLGVLRMLH